jgi:anti-sigma-K factor RskA
MQDSELKKILSETCQVLPGQEDRAWKAFQERIFQASAAKSGWSWIYLPTWRGATIAFAAVCVLAFLGNSVVSNYWPVSFASADSEAPGIYATSFYSHSAKAQVVWLNGLEPASDKPTYLDPTTVIPRSTGKPAGDPNRL